MAEVTGMFYDLLVLWYCGMIILLQVDLTVYEVQAVGLWVQSCCGRWNLVEAACDCGCVWRP